MRTITATELARNLRGILDRLVVEREELVVERNHQPVAFILPGPRRQTAMEAMSDLYRTLPGTAAASWLEDARAADESDFENGLRNPWNS